MRSEQDNSDPVITSQWAEDEELTKVLKQNSYLDSGMVFIH